MKTLKHCLLILGIISYAINPAHGAPKAKLIPFWNTSNENNHQTIDHTLWQTVLDNHVNTHDKSGIFLVDYASLKKTPTNLLDYLQQLGEIDPRNYSQAEQKAFWINLYNAATVKLIIENYPLRSITTIKNSLFSFGPWDKKWITIANKTLSLNDIEHGILRPIWQDNRIHYAVNCASLGCPNLSPTAFTAATTQELLNQLARAYINHPRGVSVRDKTITFSSIYHWYQTDFGQSKADLITHWQQFADPILSQQLTALSTLKNSQFDHQYDWALNQSR